MFLSLYILHTTTFARVEETTPVKRLDIAAMMDHSVDDLVDGSNDASDGATENSKTTYSFVRNQLLNDKLEKETRIAEAIAQERNLKGPADYERLIKQKCAQYGCNANQVIRVMWCESTGRSWARNGRYYGLFQHDINFWPARAYKYGVPGAPITDPYAQIVVSTRMFAEGGASHWGCK